MRRRNFKNWHFASLYVKLVSTAMVPPAQLVHELGGKDGMVDILAPAQNCSDEAPSNEQAEKDLAWCEEHEAGMRADRKAARKEERDRKARLKQLEAESSPTAKGLAHVRATTGMDANAFRTPTSAAGVVRELPLPGTGGPTLEKKAGAAPKAGAASQQRPRNKLTANRVEGPPTVCARMLAWTCVVQHVRARVSSASGCVCACLLLCVCFPRIPHTWFACARAQAVGESFFGKQAMSMSLDYDGKQLGRCCICAPRHSVRVR